MRQHNIILVVLKDIKERLSKYESVISFGTYFGDEITQIMEFWRDKNC